MTSVNFWSTENMNDFWSFVKMLLETVQPGVMIVIATAGVGILISIIVKTFRKAEKDTDEDEIEFRRY